MTLNDGPSPMKLLEFFVMSFVLDFISQKTINVFLGDKPHPLPGQFRYIRYPGTDATDTILATSEQLPIKDDGHTRILIISDTHERHEKLSLPAADVLIHCGDVLMTSKFVSEKTGIEKLHSFNQWLSTIQCKKKLVIGGNHDTVMERIGREAVQTILTNAIYVENELIEIEQLKLFGTPLSAGKSGNKAFQSKSFERKTIEDAPDKVDILLTHGHCPKLESKVQHSVHLWGHAHNSYGIRRPPSVLKGHPVRSLSICVPIMDKKFNPTYLPVVLDMPSHSNVLDKERNTFSSTMSTAGNKTPSTAGGPNANILPVPSLPSTSGGGGVDDGDVSSTSRKRFFLFPGWKMKNDATIVVEK